MNLKKYFSILIMISLPGLSHAVGKFPYIPNVSNTTVSASVTYDSISGRFEYIYSFSSGPDNVGDIDTFMLDIKSNRVFTPAPNDFLLLGMGSNITFEEEVNELKSLSGLSFDFDFEPVGTVLPDRWISSIGASGYLNLHPPSFGANSAGEFVQEDLIAPGESAGNLRVKGISPPTLKEIVVKPFWRYIPTALTENQLDEAERLAAGNLEASLLVRKITVGPEQVHYGDSLHIRTVNDINQMVNMGWIHDQALANQVLALMAEAQSLRYSQQGSEAQAKYQQVLDTMVPVITSQMRQEAIDLTKINVKILLDHTPDTLIPPEYDMVVDPRRTEKQIGETVIFTPKIIDRNRGDQEILGGFSYRLEVTEGPHLGLIVETGGNKEPPAGEGGGLPPGVLGYSGTKTGKDIVSIRRINFDDAIPDFVRQAEVLWTGGPDYVISFFSPPYLDYAGADNIYVADWTKNIGTTDSAIATVTRYYLSETASIDPNTAFVLHERTVTPLASNQQDQYDFVQIPWPAQFLPGTYYFAACTDANEEVVELNEINNCSYHDVEQINYNVSVLNAGTINSPPDCSAAVPSKATLWPPNHKFKKVEILGVTDVDQDEVTISVTAITQDEAVNSVSSGNTSPDGKGIGLPYAQLRAERDGTGDGRVYTIQFEASDTAENQCLGTVSVTSVVHDQSTGSSVAIDSGQIHDSTQEF